MLNWKTNWVGKNPQIPQKASIWNKVSDHKLKHEINSIMKQKAEKWHIKQ